MSRSRTLLRAVLAGTIALAAGLASAHENGWIDPAEELLLDSLEGVEAFNPEDNLCEGVFENPFGGDPGWVRVGGSSNPDTPFVEVHGQVLPSLALKGNPYVAHTDNTVNHYMMDFNVFLLLDKAHRHRLAGGNFGTGEENEHGMLEVEWERGGLPKFAWPTAGDRMIIWGTHIWDCGHGDNGLRTEIHPPVGWVVFRNTASRFDRTQTPPPEIKDQNPWIYYRDPSLDRQGTGSTFPSYQTYDTQLQATVADVFFSSFGGNVVEALNGCDDNGDFGNPLMDDAFCYEVFGEDSEWAQRMLNQDYTFFIPAPPMPESTAPMIGQPFLIWEEEDRCSEVPSNPGNPGGDVERVGEANDGAVDIGAPTCNTIPAIAVEDWEDGVRGLRVTIQAQSSGTPYPANSYIAFAKRYKVAWDFIPEVAERVKTFRTDFQTLHVYDDADDCGEEAEWVMSLRVNEKWIHPVRGSGEDGHAFWEESTIDDDKSACLGDDLAVDYSIGETLTNSIVAGEQLEIWSRSFDIDGLNNNFLPFIHRETAAAGSFTEGLANFVDEGAHTISFTVTDTTPPAPDMGVLVVDGPSYGPNPDTGGSLRIGATTRFPLALTDAQELQYRWWPQASPGDKPGTWLRDDTYPREVDTFWLDDDGRYVAEYRPMSAAGIGNTHRTLLVELDTTAPVIDVPASMSLPATSALGTTVDFTTGATDSLPGPVDFTCTHASGDFFPIRETTTVTCTATDAVGNTSTRSFDVEVYSPFGYIPDFVALGTASTRLGQGVTVASGNVGAFDAGPGILPQWPGFETVLQPSATLSSSSVVAAQTVRLETSAAASDVYSMDPVSAAPSATFTAQAGCYLPLFPSMPTTAPFSATGADATLKGTVTLPAGEHGHVKVNPHAVVTVLPGVHDFKSLQLGPKSKLLFAGPATMNVEGSVTVAQDCLVAPVQGIGLTAKDVVFWVAGTDGGGNSPTAFETTNGATVIANVVAMNGTLTLGVVNFGRGAFLGQRVVVGSGTTLELESALDVPYP